MSSQEIQQILKRLGDQDNALKAIHDTQKITQDKMNPDSESYILKEFQPMLKSYNDANTIVSFFQHTIVKSLLVVGSIAGAIIAVRELFLKK